MSNSLYHQQHFVGSPDTLPDGIYEYRVEFKDGVDEDLLAVFLAHVFGVRSIGYWGGGPSTINKVIVDAGEEPLTWAWQADQEPEDLGPGTLIPVLHHDHWGEYYRREEFSEHYWMGKLVDNQIVIRFQVEPDSFQQKHLVDRIRSLPKIWSTYYPQAQPLNILQIEKIKHTVNVEQSVL